MNLVKRIERREKRKELEPHRGCSGNLVKRIESSLQLKTINLPIFV